jgi:N-acetylglucosaminyl-diphospho-decaprenol L-rhamnosyltransferase
MKDLAIIIVAHNAADDLLRTIASLRENPPLVSHEIVVVDNASSDGGPETACRRWPETTLVQAGANLGFAAGNNLGIRRSTGELILLLNSDTFVPRGAVDTLVADLRSDPSSAAVGPRLVDGSGNVELSFGRMIGPFNELRQKLLFRLSERGVRPVRRWVERKTRSTHYPDWVSGACLLVRRDDAEAVGLIDERYFLYAEDVDFCAALRARGRRIRFCPTVEIVHLRGRSRRLNPCAERWYRRSQLAFYTKHHPAWTRWLRLYLAVTGKLPAREAFVAGPGRSGSGSKPNRSDDL